MATLSNARLREEAGEASFARGRDYLRKVSGLSVDGSKARASVRGERAYHVELDWSRRELRSWCDCPHFDRGFFCKHVVAVGMAVLAEYPELAGEDAVVRRPVAPRAADSNTLAAELDELVKHTLGVRAHVDYKRSFGVASEAQTLLDELEEHLDAGRADALLPALLRAVTRLQKIILNADDSSGLLGDAGQRALDLYARACREGHPDTKKLARWMVKFREESPGWPQLELDDFVGALGDAGLATYRTKVSALDRKQADLGRTARFEVEHMLLELADHDGDVDRAVDLLTTGEHVQYGAAIARLRAAGRDREAVEWMDRAVAAGGVSGHGGGNDFWLDPADVARTYRSLDRGQDGIEVLRAEFVRRAELKTFRQLVDFAASVGQADAERSWALGAALDLAAQPFGSGAVLVEIALAEGDLETAWSAARELGAGHQWKALAEASRDVAPLEAAALWLVGIEKDLTYPDSPAYPDIARRLAIVRDLHLRADDEAGWSAYVGQLRETYRKRPSLMAALDRQGL